MMSRRVSGFLLAVAVWNWVIWPMFLKNVAKDDRSFDDGRPTRFFLVHLVLVVVSLLIGTALGAIGWRGWREARAAGAHDRALRSFVSSEK